MLYEVITSHVRNNRPIPRIESFLEMGVAACLYDSASAFQLREYENSSFDPYCRIVGKILEEEEGHESFGAEIMIQAARDPGVSRPAPAARLWTKKPAPRPRQGDAARSQSCFAAGLWPHESYNFV